MTGSSPVQLKAKKRGSAMPEDSKLVRWLLTDGFQDGLGILIHQRGA